VSISFRYISCFHNFIELMFYRFIFFRMETNLYIFKHSIKINLTQPSYSSRYFLWQNPIFRHNEDTTYIGFLLLTLWDQATWICILKFETMKKHKWRTGTSYQCIEWDIRLCIVDCFKDDHILQSFWIMYAIIPFKINIDLEFW